MAIRRKVRELVRVMDPEPRWRERPAPQPKRVLAKTEPCPRRALAAAAARKGESYAALSRMLGRRDGYLACFVREGHPSALSERDHRMLADFFGLDERGLGVRDLWAAVA